MLGYTPGELIGQPWTTVIPPEHHPTMQAADERRARGETDQYEVELARKDGSRLHALVSGSPRLEGERWVGTMAVFTDISGLKQAEAERRQSEERFRRFFEYEPEYCYMVSPAGVILDANQAALEVLGYEKKELVGRPLNFIYAPESLPKMKQLLERWQERGEIRDEEITILTRDGQRRTVLISAGAVRDEQGTILHSVSVQRDITERKQAEEAEREQRALAEALRDSIAALTGTLDPDEVLGRILANVGRVVSFDAANVALIRGADLVITHRQGYPPEMAAFFDEVLTRALLEWPTYRTMIESGAPYLVADVHNDPAWQRFPGGEEARSYVAAPIQVHGHVIGFLNLESYTTGFFTPAHADRLQAFADQAAVAIENAQLYDEIRGHAADLERRVAARTAELEQQRAQLQAILDSMEEGVVYSENRNVLYVNPALEAMTGYPAGELIGPVANLFKIAALPEDAVEQLRQKAPGWIAGGESFEGETRLRRKDGSEFDAHMTVTQMPDLSSGITRSLTLIRDISQQKTIQAQRDRFIANAAHELRTPVTNVTMRFYLLRKQPHRMGEHLDALERSVETMRHLVDSLLDLSRFDRGIITLEKEPVVLQELIGAVFESQRLQAEAKRITLTSDLPGEPLSAVIDRDRVQQVITNLVVNAINYTPDGGRVSLRLEADADQATIQVQDTGIGIGPEVLPHIFEPFFRAREIDVPGTGLGLSITREIVHLHGGAITVDSQVGQGSAFTVRLPLS